MKKYIVVTILATALATCVYSHAVACSFNTDCQPGSTCQKSSGSIYGFCVGGISPGNKNDRVPVYAPTELAGSSFLRLNCNVSEQPTWLLQPKDLFINCRKALNGMG